MTREDCFIHLENCGIAIKARLYATRVMPGGGGSEKL